MFKIKFTFMDNSSETYEQKETYAITPVAYLLTPFQVGDGISFGLAISAHRVKFIQQEYTPDPEPAGSKPFALPN